MANAKEILERLVEAVIAGDEEAAKKAADDAVVAGIDPIEAIREGLTKGMGIVGGKFHKFEIFLPDVIVAVDAMKAGMAVLLPKISEERMADVRLGKVVIGTVYGDIHDIGKNLVATMLLVAGFEVYDIGVDVPPMKFADKAEEVRADVIAMSSLMSTTRCSQRELIDFLEDKRTRGKYYVIVGGGSVTPNWTKDIGADGYGRFADDGATICKQLMKERPPAPLKEPIILE